MKNAIRLALLSLVLVTLLPLAEGAPPKPKMVPCPVCHMPLSMRRTKANPVAMRLKKGGRIYYCCSKCTMPASMLVKGPRKKSKTS